MQKDDAMLILYFSGTGNTKYIAELFSGKTGARCMSIEDEAGFFNEEIRSEIQLNETIVFCYPIYGSRVPLIMRQFAAKYIDFLRGKKIIILVTQVAFSGDGARAFCDLFPKDHIQVVYAEHFSMPNNVCNFPSPKRAGTKTVQRRLRTAEKKMDRICRDLKEDIVKKRGFSTGSRILGSIQGKPWQGNSKNAFAAENTMEHRAKHGVRIGGDCVICNICVERCPMGNLENRQGAISHKGNCTVCYRCVNLCPQKAITTFIHRKPRRQYKGIAEILGSKQSKENPRRNG